MTDAPFAPPDAPALVDAGGLRAAAARTIPRIAAGAGARCARVFGNRYAQAFGILNYHRVVPPIDGLACRPTWNVPPAVLRAQLSGLLRRGYRPWPLARLLAAQAAGEHIPREAFAVTFDDGYENLLTHALPVLRELDVPATVFLATAYLDSPERFPFDDWPADAAAGAPPDHWRPLNGEQVRALLATGLVDVGTHTHTHGDFRDRPDALARELAVSAELLRDRFGIDRPPFALPYGVRKLGFAGPSLSDAARGAGTSCCLSTESDLVRPGDDPFDWGRFNVKEEDTAATLAGRLSGWYHFARDAWRGAKALRPAARPRTSGSGPLFVTLGSAADASRAALADTSSGTCDVSVVMCTYNRSAMVRDALASLCSLKTEGFTYEIVVIDNASPDDTAAVVAEIAAASPVPIRLVREDQPGGVAAHNRGVAEATGEWIAWFDDDEIADPDWLAALMRTAREHGARNVGGAVRVRLESDTGTSDPDGFPLACLRLLGGSNGWEQPHPYSRQEGPGSGNQLVQRSVYDEVGVYDPYYDRRGYDTDHYRRIRAAGIKSWYTPHAIIHHRTPASRLSPAYMRETSLTNGWCFARRDQAEWGRLATLVVTAARLAKATLVFTPRLIWAKLNRRPHDVLGAKCELWRTQGYVRTALGLN